MKREEIQLLIDKGQKLSRQSFTKWKNKKIVRGSFYDYYIGDEKISESQYFYFKGES